MTKPSRRASAKAILTVYDRDAPLYGAFASALRDLLHSIVAAEGVAVHSVSCRTKTKQSLTDKLSRAGGKDYKALEEVTDLCGVRVITYFADTVDRVSAIVEREFVVDVDNSIDKRATLDPDQFGYLSLHHVISLRPARAALAEYKRFAGLKAEIQTRSILQHAWAEIEHDLGYKSGLDVPRYSRRRFARLAGMLEMADEEFTKIREELRDYERRVGEEIATGPARVSLDQASLAAFVSKSPQVKELDMAIAAFAHATLVGESPAFFMGDAERFAVLGIRSIADLERALQEHYFVIAEFAREWLREKYDILSVGISLFYLWYVLVAITGNPEVIRQMLDNNQVGDAGDRDEMAHRILQTHARAVERARADH